MFKNLIDRPIATTMIMLVIVVLGIVGLRLIPVSLVPSADSPYVTVQASSPKMSAREINESVVKILCQQLSQIEGVNEIVSEAKDGVGRIKLTFAYGTDMSYTFLEVNEKIDKSIPNLPNIERPKVLKASATDIPAFYINLTHTDNSEESFAQMSKLAQDVISKRLEQLPEVSMVDISGYQQSQIVIDLDLNKIEQLGINIDEFESIIISSIIDFGYLSIQDGLYRYNVKFLSNITSYQEIADIWFDANGRLMQIKDVASVKEIPAAKNGSVHSDGSRAISMAVIKQSDAKMSDLSSNVEELIDNITKEYPAIDITITRDQTQLLKYSIDNLYQNILIGLILACIVIFLFMRNVRSSLLVFVTIPVSLLLSIVAFWATGISVNILSLSGVLLGIGMMSDNTVILIDNITGRWHRGDSLRDACVIGAQEVAMPMLSSILTTCAVFLPMVFIKGIAGELFFDQAAAMSIILIASYLVILIVVPVYYYWWFGRCKKTPKHRPGEDSKFDLFLKKWEEKIMGWFIEHWSTSWVILIVSGIGAIVLFSIMPVEKFPEITRTESIVTVDWNEQITLEENEKRVEELESLLLQECNQVTSFVGIQDFILEHTDDLMTSEASVYINCDSDRLLLSMEESVTNYIYSNYPSATLEIKQSGNVFDVVFPEGEAPLIAQIHSTTKPTLEVKEIKLLLDSLQTILPDTGIDNPQLKRDALLIADSEKMALYGVSFEEIASILRNSLYGNELFSIVKGIDAIPVYIGRDVPSLFEIISNNFIIKEDIRIPLSEFLQLTFIEDFRTINSGNNGDYYPISLNADSKEVPKIISKIQDYLKGKREFNVNFSGSWFSNNEMIQEIVFLLIVAIILLYLILAIQFESLLQPIIILSEITIDIFAALLILWAMGLSLNLMSVIGLIIVSGIVINDSILKVDTINRLRSEGHPLKEAIRLGCTRRMKAIIMTSLTTILSVVPFLSRGNIGDDLQYPMSIVIIVGMTAGTLISLFLLPSLYYSLYKKQDR